MINTASAISFPPVPLPAQTYAKQEKKVEQKNNSAAKYKYGNKKRNTSSG